MKNKKVCLIIILLIIVIIGLYYLFSNNNIENEISITKEILTENEAKELIKEKWNLAIELYGLSNKYFNWGGGKSELEIKEGENGDKFYCYPITNYNEVLEKYFSTNMYSDFEDNAICLEIIDNVPYILEGGGGFSSYDGIEEILNIQINSEKITSLIKTRHIDEDGNFLEYRETPLTLVKKGDNWLIDEWKYIN